MTDSETTERVDAKHERNRLERLDAISRWVEYIRENPPDVWGPQQNAVVNGQLESAQAMNFSAEHERRVRTIAAELATDETEEESGPDADAPE